MGGFLKQENVGESWEISGVPGNESIVADGEMQGKSLNEVVAELKGSVLVCMHNQHLYSLCH